MQLYFIRHAQSVNNALWDQTGSDVGRSSDPELTGLGHQQAERLADYLSNGGPKVAQRSYSGQGGIGITHLYSSLMLRSVQTGAPLSRRLGVPLVAWQELHERGGIYRRDPETGEVECLPGSDRGYFSLNYPELVLPDDLPEAGWWNSQPHETPEISLQRARRFLDGLLERHGGTEDRVAIISHGGFYNDILGILLHFSESDGIWFSMYNTAITRMDFSDGGIRFVYQNRVDHLPVEMIS